MGDDGGYGKSAMKRLEFGEETLIPYKDFTTNP
jgi:hypothetical protein